MDIIISDKWKTLLNDEFDKQYFHDLTTFINSEYINETVYPPSDEIFSAFNYCEYNNLKVVILGQDPYHGYGQANGLCFSVKEDVKIPPSLRNIFKEISHEYSDYTPKSGDLTHWAKQGVLLINATLTVKEKEPNSHQGKGWGTFTDAVIKRISDENKDIVFVLWGAFAQRKEKLIDQGKHYILKSPHPSPFSAHKGFLGNNHFIKINDFLKLKNKEEITW